MPYNFVREQTPCSASQAAAPQISSHLWLALLIGQGLYYAILGVWPLLDIHSFQAVGGPKTDHLVTGRESDHWLVLTVGALITIIGLTLLLAVRWKQFSLETMFLATASALALTVIDVVYVLRGVINPIYLVDAIVEVSFIMGWIVVAFRMRSRRL